jgi:hypothetical protein
VNSSSDFRVLIGDDCAKPGLSQEFPVKLVVALRGMKAFGPENISSWSLYMSF